MIYAGYVKVAQGKQQTGRVKLKISSGTGEAKFSLGEGKNPLGVLQRGVLYELGRYEFCEHGTLRGRARRRK